MKRNAFFFTLALLASSLWTWGQSDTLITLEGDTSLVEITSYGTDEIKYIFPEAPRLTLGKKKSLYSHVLFANPQLEDYQASSFWKKEDVVFLRVGAEALFDADYGRNIWTAQLVTETMLTPNVGLQYQFGIGGNTQVLATEMRLLQIGVGAFYRIQQKNSNWSAQLTGGLLWRGINPNYNAFTSQFNTKLGVHTSLGMIYTSPGGFEIGIDAPITFFLDGSMSLGVQPRIGVRF